MNEVYGGEHGESVAWDCLREPSFAHVIKVATKATSAGAERQIVDPSIPG